MENIFIFKGIGNAIKHMTQSWISLFLAFVLYWGLSHLMGLLLLELINGYDQYTLYENSTFIGILMSSLQALLQIMMSLIYVKVIYDKIFKKDSYLVNVIQVVSTRMKSAIAAGLLMLMGSLPIIYFTVKFFFVGDRDLIGILLYILVILVLCMHFIFISQFIMIGNNSGVAAIKHSVLFVKQFFFKIVGSMILMFILALIAQEVVVTVMPSNDWLSTAFTMFYNFMAGVFFSAVLTELFCQHQFGDLQGNIISNEKDKLLVDDELLTNEG